MHITHVGIGTAQVVQTAKRIEDCYTVEHVPQDVDDSPFGESIEQFNETGILSQYMVRGLFGSLGNTVFQLYLTATIYGTTQVFAQLAEQWIRNQGGQADVAVRLQLM
ncbi:hypothetical protein D3C75_1087710 [compost metagenome]